MTRARVEVDHTAKAAYIDFGTDVRPVGSSVDFCDSVVVDLDEFGVVVGLELLSLNLSALPLSDLKRDCHFRQEDLALLERNVTSILDSLRVTPKATTNPGEAASAGFQFA